MRTRLGQTGRRKASAAFTLAEVVVSIAILALAMAGMIYGYVQTNYRAEWSSMSLAVQALTIQSIEQSRAARWDVYSGSSAGSTNELTLGTVTTVFTNAVLVPASGQTMSVTNVLQISTISTVPQVRQIRSDCKWYFPRSGTWFTNTVITYRAGT